MDFKWFYSVLTKFYVNVDRFLEIFWFDDILQATYYLDVFGSHFCLISLLQVLGSKLIERNLNLLAPTPQNDQTHSRSVLVCLTILWGWHQKG